MYGKDLESNLKSETSGSFWDTLECLMMTPIKYDSYSYLNAIKGLGTDGIINLLINIS